MSQPLMPCYRVFDIGLRSLTRPPTAARTAIKYSARRLASPARSQLPLPQQSSLQSDKKIWGFANLAGALHKYLGSGTDHITALKGSPSEGAFTLALRLLTWF
jgi:hypothetical protein